MSHYRLYFRDSDGHFSGCRQFEALSDVQAISRADRMARGFNRELWWESRLLRQWGDGTGNHRFQRYPSDLGSVLRGDASSSNSGDSSARSASSRR